MMTDFLSGLKDIVIAIAGMLTAFAAISGIRRWQMELRGKAYFDAARALAKAMYKLRDELAACRAPMVFNNEFPEGYRNNPAAYGAKQPTPEEEGKAWSYVYTNRMKPVIDAVRAFDAARLEAEVLWGDEILRRAEALRQCVTTLNANIQAYIDDKLAGGAHFQADKNFGKDVRSHLNATKGLENKFTLKIELVVKELEQFLSKHLHRDQNIVSPYSFEYILNISHKLKKWICG